MSTLYARTATALEALEASVAAEAAAGATPAGHAREALARATALVDGGEELQPAVAKMKANADERDPTKTTYGPGMVAKVLALHARFVTFVDAAAQLKARLSPNPLHLMGGGVPSPLLR
jgi:hypothetical protein